MSQAPPAPRRTPLARLLLGVLLALAVGAVGSGVRSLRALSARHAQAEREAAESEAQLVEQLALRERMAVRLRALEEEGARLTRERDALRAQLEARAAAPKAAKAPGGSKAERRKRAAAGSAAAKKKARAAAGTVRVASTAR